MEGGQDEERTEEYLMLEAELALLRAVLRAVMNNVPEPQNFAHALDCRKGYVFADRVVLLEIQFRAGRGAKCTASHRPYCYVMWTPGA